MKKKLFILNYALIILSLNFYIFSYSSFAEEGEDIEKIKVLINTPGNFNIKVEAEGQEGHIPITVDGITTFVIARTDGGNEASSYKLYYFLEQKIDRIIDYVLLPYKFQQTYMGLLEGNYEVGFILIDALGNYGVCTVPVYVKHKGKN